MALTKAYTFSNNTIIDPAEVNANDDAHLANVRGQHHRDEDGSPIEPADIASGWGLVPSKGIIIYNDTIANIPSGYYFCNGANGTPDLRNKFVLCPGQDSGGTYDTGDTGGEASHILTVSEMPSHGHGVNDPTHKHVVTCRGGSTSDGHVAIRGAANGATDTVDGGNDIQYAATGISIQNNGSGAAHNNMPPFKALVYIMKS